MNSQIRTDRYQFSKILVKYLSDDTSIKPLQIELINSINILCKQNLNGIILKSSMTYSTFKHISRSISAYINHELICKTINGLIKETGQNLEEIIKSLNIIYKFSEDDAYVPNLKNYFYKYDQLQIASYDIKLTEIINFQILLSDIIDPRESLNNSLVMKGIKCHLITNLLDFQGASSKIDSLISNNYERILRCNITEHFYCSLIDDDDAEEYLIIPLFFDENNEIDLNEHIVEITTDLQETSLIFIIPSANDFNGNTLNETIQVIPSIGADINDLNIVESISETISIDNDDFAFKGCDKYYFHVKNNYIETHSVKFDQWKSSFLSQEKKLLNNTFFI